MESRSSNDLKSIETFKELRFNNTYIIALNAKFANNTIVTRWTLKMTVHSVNHSRYTKTKFECRQKELNLSLHGILKSVDLQYAQCFTAVNWGSNSKKVEQRLECKKKPVIY